MRERKMDFFIYRQRKLGILIYMLQIVTFLVVLLTSIIVVPLFFVEPLFRFFLILWAVYLITFGLLQLYRKERTLFFYYSETYGEFVVITMLILLTHGHMSPFQAMYILPVTLTSLRVGQKGGLITAAIASFLILYYHLDHIEVWGGTHMLMELNLMMLMFLIAWLVGGLVSWEKKSWSAYVELEDEKWDQIRRVATLQERGRLAREIHDNIAQNICYLRLETKLIRQELPKGGHKDIDDKLKQMEECLDNIYQDIRQVINELQREIEKDGFLVTAQKIVYKFGEDNKISSEYIVNLNWDDLKLSVFSEIQLIRILKELLSNVRRHSQARSVSVTLERSKSMLKISVEDDGVGFKRRLVRNAPDKFGLKFIEERLNLISGKWKVTSKAGEGTKVVIMVPLEKKEQYSKRASALKVIEGVVE